MKQFRGMRSVGLLALLLALVCAALPIRAYGWRGNDRDSRVAIFSSITVSEDHPADDIVCAFCTVAIDGDVGGDVAVMFSTVTVADGRTVSGDVATLFSTLVVGEGARINGDLATALGTTTVAESAHVNGDRAVLASGLGITVILAPLLIVIGVIWLLVWGARRIFV